MKLPKIRQVAECLGYNPETGELVRLSSKQFSRWVGLRAGWITPSGYHNVRVQGVVLAAHRVAWALQTGEWPVEQIDHINGNRADNRWCNLRSASVSQNGKNRRVGADNTSGYKGVSWKTSHGRWVAQIAVDGKKLHLGLYERKEQAKAAYDLAAYLYHGEFCNFGDKP